MASVILLHAWWGLNEDVRAFAGQLRAHGHMVETPDLYGGGQIAADIPAAERLMGGRDTAAARAGIDAALERFGGAVPVGVVGFSMGASFAWDLVDRHAERVGALVTYYGPTEPSEARAVPPVLAHLAEHDDFEDGTYADLEPQLSARNVEHQVHVYPGTRHWFAEPSRPEFDAQASALALDRTLEWLGRTTR